MAGSRALVAALAVLALAVTALAANLPLHSHPKLRRSVDSVRQGQHCNTGRQLIVLKETNSSSSSSSATSLGTASKTLEGKDRLLTFLQASSQPSAGVSIESDALRPNVTYYKDIGIGYAAEMNSVALVTVLGFEEVEFVEEDSCVTGERAYQYPIELNWAVDRVDQRRQPLDGSYSPRFTGRGVDIYILDSGIRYSHSVFGGRARYGGYDAFGRDGRDCHGHGTHCAGLAAGRVSGVAHDASVYSIRVLDCNNGGSFEGIITGINHVIGRAQSTRRRSVISMSLIGPMSLAGNRAVKAAADAGIVVVVAAGNFRRDACSYSPASSPHAITVGGTQEDGDKLYWFSSSANSPGTNYGKCVDVFAPGQWVRSASHTSDRHFVSMSGTSMSTPMVAGVAATILEEFPHYRPREVQEEMRRRATVGVIDMGVLHSTARAQTPNLLVYVQRSATAPTTTTPAPTTQATPTTDTPAPTQDNTPSTTPSNPTPPPTSSSPTTPITTTTRPAPRLVPLPHQTSRALERYSLASLQQAVSYGRRIGYAPTTVNTYRLHSNQYFSAVLTYVGEDRTQDYKTFAGVTIQQAYAAVRENTGDGFQPLTMAVYTVGDAEEVRIVLVLEKTDRERSISFGLGPKRWTEESRRMHQNNFFPVLVRHHTLKGGSFYISTIFEKNSYKTLHWEMSFHEVVDMIHVQRSHGRYAADVTYRITASGEVRYSLILDSTQYGRGEYFLHLAYSPETFDSRNRYLQRSSYHAVAITPLPEKVIDPVGYLAIYWR